MATRRAARDTQNPEVPPVAHEHLSAYETTLSFIEEYGLIAHDTDLARLLQSVRADRPGSIDRRLWDAVRSRAAQFEMFHRDYPFLVAPPGTLSGRPVRTPLRQVAD